MNENEVKKLYTALINKGFSANDIGDENTFVTKMGDQNSRKQFYDAISKTSFRIGDYDTFEKRLTSSDSPLSQEERAGYLMQGIVGKRNTSGVVDDFSAFADNMREYGDKAPVSQNMGQSIESSRMFNPESGKMEKTFVTPSGSRYNNKNLADFEVSRYREAADMTVNGQLRRARAKLEELQAKKADRTSEVHDEAMEFNESKLTGLGQMLVGGDIYVAKQRGDSQKGALDVAIRQTEELIKDLEEQKDRDKGVDVGFWRGVGRTMGDSRSWDFGIGNMGDAITMLHSDKLADENATEGEKDAYNEMMSAIYNKEQADRMYGDNRDFWYKAGVTTGYMPSFMIDFIATGGGFKGLNLLSKGGAKAATKIVGKEISEEIAEKGFKQFVKDNGVKGFMQYGTDWTVKALGTMGDDLLVRAPMMANTVQFGKTASDIIDRKLGDVVVNEDGSYDFTNDKTWSSAIWQGEANAIVENYSEMFGGHLGQVVDLGKLGKLANVIGAKRLGNILTQADAGSLGGIMGQTQRLFNEMGVGDYFGEVTEEFYGQLWRTVLNLDDAYIQNPDGTRTNLFATSEFYGDVLGGMALSMGLMGAAKTTYTGARYASAKHNVNKADKRAAVLFGDEWEGIRATIDNTTNDNMGTLIQSVLAENYSTKEMNAILSYMESSMVLRGFNLGTLARSRGEQNEIAQQVNESYLDGYNASTPQEMNNAQNMYEHQREKALSFFTETELETIANNPVAHIDAYSGEQRDVLLDYINAKQVRDGMIQRVRDDIDSRIEESNTMVDSRTNTDTGMIQGATMKVDDRKVYIIKGNLVQYDDKSGINNSASSESVIIRDAQTGKIEIVSPDAILNIDDAIDPNEEKATAAEVIRTTYAQAEADKMEGKLTFNPGDTYTLDTENGQMQVQIIANEQGIVDNGDGTINVTDGQNIFPVTKQTFQDQVDAANKARVAQYDALQQAERSMENTPEYALNDKVVLRDANGNTINGQIAEVFADDGYYIVDVDVPINGSYAARMTRDELNNMLVEHNGVNVNTPSVPAQQAQSTPVAPTPSQQAQTPAAPQSNTALSRIPTDAQGNPIYEQTDADTAWDAIVEQTEGDEAMAQSVAESMLKDKQTALSKAEKMQVKGGTTIAEKIAAEKEHKAAIDAAQQEVNHWKKIAGTANRRKMEADAERRRTADEAAALRKAEEEKLRADREEAERIESGEQTADSAGSIDGDSRGIRSESEDITQSANVVSTQKYVNGIESEAYVRETLRTVPLRKRAEKWMKETGVPVRLIGIGDEIKNNAARKAINAGEKVTGWFDGNEVVLYLPNIGNEKEIDNTFVHEVVAHKGLRALMGNDFDALCDKVWEMMSEEQRAYYMDYPGVNGDTRKAADEYMAHLAEGVDLTDADKTVWQRIVEAVRKFLVKFEMKMTDKDIENLIKASYSNLREQSADSVERLRENVGNVDAVKGDVQFAVQHVLKGNEREQAIKDLMAVTGRSRRTVEKWLKAEESLASVILNEDNLAILDLEADESVPSIWKNSDYPQGTVEFSNICKKRLPFTTIYQRLQKEFPNTLFDAQTLNTIRNTMKEKGEDVACALCFVEDRRQLLGEIGQGFIDAVKGMDVELNDNQKTAMEKLKESGDKYVPNLFDIITLDGMKELRKKHPAVAQAFIEYNNARGMQAGRLFQAYSAYNREILKYNRKKVEGINNNGGLRIFSFSDFEAHHLIDLVQVLTDCAAKGIKVQGYTKVPEFAKAVKDTNAKINRSLIPKGVGYVDADYVPKEGEAVSPNVINGKRLLFDTVEGIDVNNPNFFDSTNSKSVGNILVAINDEHARLAMADPFVDYIIGFHTGQSKAILKGKGIDTWVNYKNEQLDKEIVTDKNGNQKMKNAPKHGLNIYTDVLNVAEAEGNPIKTAKQFTERFIEECNKRGWIPRFHRFLNRAKDGRFLYTPGYHKFLIDFKLFDKNGKILPQEAVVPVFDNEFNKQILDEYVKGVKEEMPNDAVYEAVKKAVGLGEGTRFRMTNAEKEVANVVIKDTEGQKLPTNREEAFEYIPAKGVSFPNLDQKINVKVSRKSVKHTSLHNNKDTFAIFAAMREVIGNAVKIGSIPVAQDEIGHTHSVNIFYVPINVNGRQYSARLVVKELENKGVVLDELALYNVSMHKEKDSVVQPLNASKEVGGITTEPKSVYKIKDLIHNSQELDKEIVGISGRTRFRVTPEYKQHQMDIINATNPAPESNYTWIRSVEDIKSFEEALDDSDYADYKGEDFDPSYTWDMAEEALNTGKVTVYSSYPIKNGVFVTPSYMEAQSYGGTTPYMAKVNLEDVAWIDPTQGQLATDNKVSSKKAPSDIRFRVANQNQEIFVSNAQKAVEGIKQEKATPDQWLAMLQKNGGLKAGEDKWLGLSEWLNGKQGSVTKQEILDFITENKIVIEEVKYGGKNMTKEDIKNTPEYKALVDNLSETDENGNTFISEERYDYLVKETFDFKQGFKLEDGQLEIKNPYAAKLYLDIAPKIIHGTRLDYTTKGLKNKAEIALTVPAVEPYNQNDEVHFGDAGGGRAVAWVRSGETTDSEGNRVLVIDEIQSKRHQDGREKGYRSDAKIAELKSKADSLVAEQEQIAKDILHKQGYIFHDEEIGKFSEKHEYDALTGRIGSQEQMARQKEIDSELYVINHELRGLYNGIPDAPFEKNWHELAFKRMLRLAAEEGFDKVAWATGEQQAQRYALSNGEGMKSFYDKMIPSFVSKYTKKWGAKVGEVTMPNLEENNTMWSVDITPEMQESVMEGQTMFRISEEQDKAYIDAVEAGDMETAQAMVDSAAQAAGYNSPRLYHGTKSEFNVFNAKHNDPGSKGFFFTDSEEMASSYGKNIKQVYLRVEDPYVIEGNGRNWNNLHTDIFSVIPEIEDQIRAHEIAMKRFLENGDIKQSQYDYFRDKYYDKVDFIKDESKNSIFDIIKKYIYRWQIRNFNSKLNVDRTRDFEWLLQQLDSDVNIIFKDITDYGANITDYESIFTPHDVYVTTNPKNIKSADAVTYDDNGNVIPLSERFNENEDDVRFRVSEAKDKIKEIIGADGSSNKSIYAEGKTESGEKWVIRVSDHPARIENFKDKNEDADYILSIIIDEDFDSEFAHKWYHPITNDENTWQVVVNPKNIDYDVLSKGIDRFKRTGDGSLVWDGETETMFRIRQITDKERQTMINALSLSEGEEFYDNVFNGADQVVRENIVAIAAKNGWDFRKATEEYLGSLADNNPRFDEVKQIGLWDKVKGFFVYMLNKIGLNGFTKDSLADNDLRYILWRRFKNPKGRKDLFEKAEDIAKQYELGVGDYAEEDGDTLFRTYSSIRDRYDKAVRVPNKSGSVKWHENSLRRLKEAYYDNMHALKKLQDLIAEETGKPIQSYENSYEAENHMSSENKAQAEIFERDFFNPLKKVVQSLIELGGSYEKLKTYIIAKHGLERNAYMRNKAVQNGENGDRDFSGLTDLTGIKNVADAEIEAQRIVDEYEKKYDTTELWEKINAATKETLRKSYDSGLISKETYEEVRDMYKYYIPLRGWDIDVASDEYEYLNSGRIMLSPALNKAKGRTSLADDPLATIGFMAESTIIQGNRNKVKMKFLNMALNHPTDLISVSEQWYVLDNATGEWEPRNPIIPEGATGDQVAAIVEQHEQQMIVLGDKATKIKDGLKLNKNITKREGQEHVVRVKRNGKEYCLYINGSPRAAQAINGLLNPNINNTGLKKVANAIKHWMAAMFTSKNPTFIFLNLSRDVIWAGASVAIKENAAYNARYTKNIAECLLKAQLPRLLKKFQNGTLDMNNELERYFDEFIRNGGETGFTQLHGVDDYKRNINRFVEEAQGKGFIVKKTWDGMIDNIEFMNRCAEDTTRFMVYMTSRQMGRDVMTSVTDAKEITVNFNRKGSGGLGASLFNFCYLFFNASIQSAANFGKLLVKHPKKSAIALTLFSSAGFLVPMLNMAIRAMFSDDEDDNSYWDLPEWIRRNNIVLYVPWTESGYLTIPVPHELRPFYGMGEIAFSCLMGKEDVEDGLKKASLGFTQLIPLDFTGNGGNFWVNITPTIGQPIAQIITNKDYFGKPIYKKNDWNERSPEWTKAYKSTTPWLIDATKWLNEISGGDNVKKGKIDLNPALIEHIFESYTGGTGKTLNNAQKTFAMLWNEDLREWRNVPIIGSFYRTTEEQTAGSQINREYYEAVEEMKDVQHLINGYKREFRMGNLEYAEKIDELINSEIFKRYGVIYEFSNAIKEASDYLKLIDDTTDREKIETGIMNLKVDMFKRLEEINKAEELKNAEIPEEGNDDRK